MKRNDTAEWLSDQKLKPGINCGNKFELHKKTFNLLRFFLLLNFIFSQYFLFDHLEIENIFQNDHINFNVGSNYYLTVSRPTNSFKNKNTGNDRKYVLICFVFFTTVN